MFFEVYSRWLWENFSIGLTYIFIIDFVWFRVLVLEISSPCLKLSSWTRLNVGICNATYSLMFKRPLLECSIVSLHVHLNTAFYRISLHSVHIQILQWVEFVLCFWCTLFVLFLWNCPRTVYAVLGTIESNQYFRGLSWRILVFNLFSIRPLVRGYWWIIL